MTLTEKLDYFIRNIECICLKHDEAQAESLDRLWRETMIEASARIKAIGTVNSGRELHDHFIKNHLEELREQAHPDGCPFCEELEGDVRCRGCAEILATIDAIESVSAEVTNLRELASMVWVNSCIESPVSTDYVVPKEHMLALRDYVQTPASGRRSLNPCSDCESNYLRFCEYPPALSKPNTDITCRIECADCGFCGPFPPEHDMNQARAIAGWNKTTADSRRGHELEQCHTCGGARKYCGCGTNLRAQCKPECLERKTPCRECPEKTWIGGPALPTADDSRQPTEIDCPHCDRACRIEDGTRWCIVCEGRGFIDAPVDSEHECHYCDQEMHAPICGHVNILRDGPMHCTRQVGHSGRHIACGAHHNIGSWPHDAIDESGRTEEL